MILLKGVYSWTAAYGQRLRRTRRSHESSLRTCGQAIEAGTEPEDDGGMSAGSGQLYELGRLAVVMERSE